MAYAANHTISQSPIDGGIEITDQQYRDALAGMMAGKVVSIADGFSVDFPPEPEPVEPEPPTKEELWTSLRAERDGRLKASDWTQLADVPDDPDGSAKAAWVTYRQALRDLPANTADPAAPVWPVAPLNNA